MPLNSRNNSNFGHSLFNVHWPMYRGRGAGRWGELSKGALGLPFVLLTYACTVARRDELVGTRSLPCSPCHAASKAAVANRAEAPVARPQKGQKGHEARRLCLQTLPEGLGKTWLHPALSPTGAARSPWGGGGGAGPQKCAQKPPAVPCRPRTRKGELATPRSEAPACHVALAKGAGVPVGHAQAPSLSGQGGGGGCKHVISHTHGFLVACSQVREGAECQHFGG